MNFTQVQRFVAIDLTASQKAFKKAPNAQNWQLTLRAMLVHQQLDQLNRPVHAQARAMLLVKLADMPLDDWGDAIVEAMTGRSVMSVLSDHS